MPDKALERLIGAAEELLSMTFVARAAFVLRSVGRIIDRRGRYGFGTGFLVAPGVLMTNEHVLGTVAQAGSASAQFQNELDDGLRELDHHEVPSGARAPVPGRPRPRLRPRRRLRSFGAGRLPAHRFRLPAARRGRGQRHPRRPAGQHHPAPGRRTKADLLPARACSSSCRRTSTPSPTTPATPSPAPPDRRSSAIHGR